MGNKIITEKDFFQCSGGMMPSPFQSTQLIVKKKTGDKYITLNDTSTVSWVDFGCKKLMLLYAVIAAIAVVAVALIVGTGGLALVAVGAAAGAVGAVMGAIDGSSICGQKVSPVRKWLGSNANFQILGINTITGDHKMQCNAFNMLGMSSEFITFNPDIKNWSQAIAMGSASFTANVLQGAMTGMMIGGAAVAIPAMATGGMAAITEGGGMGLARYLGGNVAKNYLASWFTAEGLGLRGVMGVQSGLDAYGQTGSVSESDVSHGITGMESGTAASVKNIGTGQGNILDVLGVALWFTPAGELLKGKEAKAESKGPNENRGKNENESSRKSEEEQAKTANQTEAKENEIKRGEEEAYQANKMELITVDEPFKPGEGHDVAEFERQIKGQQEGMNKLTVDDFIKNRDAYTTKLAEEKAAGKKKPTGRSKESGKAQERYRQKALDKKIEELEDSGMDYNKAKEEAEKYMSDKAALHDPDQVAGGFDDRLTGMGDSKINSSIGRQWQDRIGQIDSKVREAAENMTEAERKSTYLNAHLYP